MQRIQQGNQGEFRSLKHPHQQNTVCLLKACSLEMDVKWQKRDDIVSMSSTYTAIEEKLSEFDSEDSTMCIFLFPDIVLRDWELKYEMETSRS